MKGIAYAVLVLVLAIASAALVWRIPQARFDALEGLPAKLLLMAMTFVLVVNLGLSLYTHLVPPTSRRVLLRVLGFLLSTGGTLSIFPFLASSFQEAEIRAMVETGRARLPGEPDRVLSEVVGRVRMAESKAASDSAWFFGTTAIGSIILAIAHAGVCGAQRIWEASETESVNRRRPKKRRRK